MLVSAQGERQQFFNNLLKALRPVPNKKDGDDKSSVACETIKPSQGFSLKSFHVEGVGELKLPLSAEDTSKLFSVCEKEPYGDSSDSMYDDNDSLCCRQVDASKVRFPREQAFLSNTVQALARKAVCALDLYGAGMQFEAQLCKLQLHDNSTMYFPVHWYLKKNEGIFAYLILQLPTEEGYTGGELWVTHKGRTKKFDAHMVSATGFCYTIFFADCWHKIWPIKSGTNLCLAFNLVDSNKRFTPDWLNKVEAALEPWLEEVTKGTGNVFGRIICIPLQHEYTRSGLSFPALHPEDGIVAELLKDCKDKNGKQWLDLHLCVVTNFDTVRCQWLADDLKGFETGTWIGSDGTEVLFKDVGIDMKKEVGFGDIKDQNKSDRSYCYYRAMLVAWPKADSLLRACGVSASKALDVLEKMSEIIDSNLTEQLHQFVSYCEKNAFKVWEGQTDSSDDNVSPRLLNLCTRVKALEIALRTLQLLATDLQGGPNPDCKVGVRNVEVAKAVADTVKAFGWESVSLPIIELAKTFGSTQCESFAKLAEQLKCTGNMGACAVVGNAASQVLEARIDELESSHKVPEMTWCQPRAKFPD